MVSHKRDYYIVPSSVWAEGIVLSLPVCQCVCVFLVEIVLFELKT